jgi:ring-1,2-phenylacetyl-CoA epoxidase subunit PaaC
VDEVWPLIDELFRPHEVELRLAAAGVGVDPAGLRPEFDGVLTRVLEAATLVAPGDGVGPPADGGGTAATADDGGGAMAAGAMAATADAALTVTGAWDGVSAAPGGRDGVHTAALAEILGEMQELARSVPGGAW